MPDPEPTRAPNDAALVDRVRKLLAKAEATANPHEAEAFSRKAAALIAQHRIDPVRLAAAVDADELGVREVQLGRGAYVRARLALLMAVAETHDGFVVFRTTPTGTLATVAGFHSDLDLIDIMYHSLHTQAAAQMAGIRQQTGAATQRFRRAFLFGFADRIATLLADARVASAAAAASVPGQRSVELALQARADRVEEFARARIGRIHTARRPGSALRSGWEAGSAAANTADVGRARLAGRAAIGRGR